MRGLFRSSAFTVLISENDVVLRSQVIKLCGASILSDRGVAAGDEDATQIQVERHISFTVMCRNEISETGSGPCQAKEIESVKTRMDPKSIAPLTGKFKKGSL